MSESQGTKIFVSNLKRLMHEKQATQEDVSKALKIHQTTVSAWVNGSSYPRIKTLQRLADYFNVPITDLTSEQKAPLSADDILFNDMLKRLSDYDKKILLLTMQRLLDKPQ